MVEDVSRGPEERGTERERERERKGDRERESGLKTLHTISSKFAKVNKMFLLVL